MACFQIDAELLACRLHRLCDFPAGNSRGALLPAPPEPQDAAQILETLHAVFAAAAAPEHDEERPQKRRKKGADNSVDIDSMSFQKNRSVVLAKVSINLVVVLRPHNTVRQTDEPSESLTWPGAKVIRFIDIKI